MIKKLLHNAESKISWAKMGSLFTGLLTAASYLPQAQPYMGLIHAGQALFGTQAAIGFRDAMK